MEMFPTAVASANMSIMAMLVAVAITIALKNRFFDKDDDADV